MPGTKKRVALYDEQGQRIRGKENKEAAEVALAREKLSWEQDDAGPASSGDWIVARVCSEYLQYCERGVAGVHRFLKIKRDLNWEQDPVRSHYSCYTCRHTFAHRMLAGYWNDGVGCSIEVLAELMGDTPKVAFDHYGREWGQHFQEPLWMALGL